MKIIFGIILLIILVIAIIKRLLKILIAVGFVFLIHQLYLYLLNAGIIG